MGSCLSKKSACGSSSPVELPKPPENLKSETTQLEKKTVERETPVKKEIFIIKHRKSHEIERPRSDDETGQVKMVEPEKGKNGNVLEGAAVRTSSCTKEEVDAILIQCGRLSRSSSTGKAALSSEKKYSGSKRSYDFDNDNENGRSADGEDDEAVARERENRRRERHRQSQGRRRTPSREREKDQQRSGSRERGGSGGGGRRVSRSPGRRSESPITTSNSNSSAPNTTNSRPGKMVSVPPTVSSAAAGGGETNIKRIQVKRNVGGDGARTGASPRARARASSNENQQQQQQPPLTISLSRSNSRKAEHSPYRRNPLADIDTNIISSQKPITEKSTIAQGPENRINSSNQIAGHQHHHVALNVISSSAPENPKPNNTLTRSRSSRLSRDLDETLSNPNAQPSSYTALLLEDIQNFHQKNTAPPPPPAAFTLPPCVTKACSILEAVADLNSSTGSNLSLSEDRRRNLMSTEQTNRISDNKPSSASANRKTKQEMGDPILESEVSAKDDLMEPSFHTYVTVRRGGDLEEEESSGSNSIIGSQQNWVSSSSWEPNSAESTDRWTTSSSRTVSRQSEEGGKRVSAKKVSSSDHQRNGLGRGRIGIGGGAST